MIVLGIDPGIDRTGYAVIESTEGRNRLKTVGCIKTNNKQTDTERLVYLYYKIEKLILTYIPQTVAIESLFFTTNAKTVMAVGQARGTILLACGLASIPVVAYTPLEVKLAVTGYGRAEKIQVQQMIKSILKLPVIPKPDDAADAVAVALTHMFSYKIKSLKHQS